LSQSDELQRKATSRVGKPAPESSDGERLAWSSSDEEIDACAMNRVSCIGEPREIAVVRHVGVSVLQHRRREGFDLAERSRIPAERVPGDGRGLDA
jgi:hypothetical protein